MAAYDLDRLTALVVEDNEFVRNTLEDLLRHFGMTRISTAGNGEEAIGHLKDMKQVHNPGPDIIISDIVMAPINGLLLLRWARTAADSPNRFVTGTSIVLGGPVAHWYAGDAFGERHGDVPDPTPRGAHDGNITHVQAIPPNYDGLVRVDFTEPAIDVFEYDPVTGMLVRRRLVGPAAMAALSAGRPVAAYADPGRGLTVGATSGDLVGSAPGELFTHRGGDPAVEIVGTVGLDVRDLDCIEIAPDAGNDILCVASSFADDRLTPFLVDEDVAGDLTVTLAEPTTIGDGPGAVGVRLVESGGARSARDGGGAGDPVAVVEVVSTGFFDESVHVTRYAADGSLVEDIELSLPDGCSGPASALWLETGFVVSCFNSGAVAVFPEPGAVEARKSGA